MFLYKTIKIIYTHTNTYILRLSIHVIFPGSGILREVGMCFNSMFFYCWHFIWHWPTCTCKGMFFLIYNDLVGVHPSLSLFLQCCCSPLQTQRILNQRWRKTSPKLLCIQSHVTFLGLSEFIIFPRVSRNT